MANRVFVRPARARRRCDRGGGRAAGSIADAERRIVRSGVHQLDQEIRHLAEAQHRNQRHKLIALVGPHSRAIDDAAATEHGIRVATGLSGSPEAPAELAVALMPSARRNVASEAERMKTGERPVAPTLTRNPVA